MRRRQGYMQAGDALRALAAMMVLGYHVLYAAALAAGGAAAYRTGTGELMRGAYGSVVGTIGSHLNAGVYVFFALTGYFVGGAYVRAWIAGEPAPGARRYLGRRIRRIVPAFWLFAALSIVVLDPPGTTPGSLASVFGFAQNYHRSWTSTAVIQAWTLDIEIAFYLALPLLAWLLARPLRGRRVPPAAMVAIVLAIGALSLVATPGYPALTDSWSMSLPCVLWAFAPGLALAAAEPALAPRLRGRAGQAMAIALLVAAAAAFAAVTQISTTRTVAHCLALGLFAGSLVAAPLVWQWATGGAPGWVVTRPAHALGRWSYGIYLCHYVLSIKLVELAPSGAGPKQALLIAAPLTVAASIALAALSWRLLERPILEWRSASRFEPDVVPPLSAELSTRTA